MLCFCYPTIFFIANWFLPMFVTVNILCYPVNFLLKLISTQYHFLFIGFFPTYLFCEFIPTHLPYLWNPSFSHLPFLWIHSYPLTFFVNSFLPTYLFYEFLLFPTFLFFKFISTHLPFLWMPSLSHFYPSTQNLFLLFIFLTILYYCYP